MVKMGIPLIPAEPQHRDRELLRRMGEKVRRRLAGNPAAVRIPAEQAELWAVSNFFSASECAGLIAMIDDIAEPSQVYQAHPEGAFRTSYSANLDPFYPLVRTLRRRIDQLLGIDGRYGEILQGQRYSPGQYFKTHTDWFHDGGAGWATEKDNGGQRSYTAMVYLNDVFDGGETDFPRLDLAIAPRAGTLLAWNNADADGVPNPYTLHAGNPLGSGLKYVVTRWYRVGPTALPPMTPRPPR